MYDLQSKYFFAYFETSLTNFPDLESRNALSNIQLFSAKYGYYYLI